MKNPFMSLWLSAANSMIGSARGQATAAVKRETRKAAANATAVAASQIVDFWTSALKPPALTASAPARKTRKVRKRRRAR